MAASNQQDDLPNFDRPPVVEVVMGVQFKQLQAMLAPHYGDFWNTVRAEYPLCTENPPIMPVVEDLSTPGEVKDSILGIVPKPPLPRVFFEHKSKEWVIQLQRDRFLHNWRVADGARYPRYPSVRAAFLAQWKNFLHFVETERLGPVEPTQVEITYLNHIAPWSDDLHLGDVLPDFSWRPGPRVLPLPEAFNFSCSFSSEDRTSRLRANVRPATLGSKKKVLLFELTVRGTTEDGDLEQWFDRGRKWIVTSFVDMTSPKCHQEWGMAR